MPGIPSYARGVEAGGCTVGQNVTDTERHQSPKELIGGARVRRAPASLPCVVADRGWPPP